MTGHANPQQHWTIAKTKDGTREAKIAAAIERMGVKGFTELVDRLLEMEEAIHKTNPAQP